MELGFVVFDLFSEAKKIKKLKSNLEECLRINFEQSWQYFQPKIERNRIENRKKLSLS